MKEDQLSPEIMSLPRIMKVADLVRTLKYLPQGFAIVIAPDYPDAAIEVDRAKQRINLVGV